jgi:hypothetical protein
MLDPSLTRLHTESSPWTGAWSRGGRGGQPGAMPGRRGARRASTGLVRAGENRAGSAPPPRRAPSRRRGAGEALGSFMEQGGDR